MSKQEVFFSDAYNALIESPNGQQWFHSMPLPDGSRISGANPDKDRERKLWSAFFATPGQTEAAFLNKRVLDIGANDGWFTLAAALVGAKYQATAVNPVSASYPLNIFWAAAQWNLYPEVIENDFMALPEHTQYDTILFFGVLYHCENVYKAVHKLKRLLAPGGTIFIETQVTRIEADVPICEMASDIYATTVPQFKHVLHKLGDSNYLLPNDAAVRSLFDSVGLVVDRPPSNTYEACHPYRRVFTAKHAD
jgi:2-polyprenyl-3-methyl-5-hydroxy-6-metoxy-1,4-benzoquinol methylase